MIRIDRGKAIFQPGALFAASQYQAETNLQPANLAPANLAPDFGNRSPNSTSGGLDTLLAWGGAALGILPFLLFGGAYLLKAAYELGWPVGVPTGLVQPAPLIVYGVLSLGLILCWLAGFPRWSLAYLGMAFYFGYDLSHAQIFGVNYGLTGWLPMACGLVVGLLLSQSFRPVVLLFQSIWNDWPRLSFGIYAYMLPMMTIIFFEGNWGLPEFYGLIFDTLLLSAGAVAFLLSQTALKQAASLQAAMFVIMVRGIWMGGWLGGTAGISSISLPALLFFIAVWGGLMFAPGLLVLLRRGLGVDKFVEGV